MNNIIKKIFIIILFPICLYSEEPKNDFKELYSKMKEKYSSIYPKTFEAYIEAKLLKGKYRLYLQKIILLQKIK